MKILHIAPDRDAALVAAHVVQGMTQDVSLTWVQTPASALQFLQENPDTAAVIVEVQAQSCAAFVEQVRGLGLTTPVVVVAGSARLEPALAALNSGADGYVVAGPSLDADLPRIVSAAIDRERTRRQRQTQTLTELEARHSATLARENRIGLALQQRLLELETALRKADERRASEAVSFADQLAKRHTEFTANLAQAAQSRDALAAELSVATATLDEAQQARKTDAAAAAEHLRQREAELHADLAAAVAARTALEHALAEAEAAHRETRQRAATDLAEANERQAALEDLLTQETDRRTSLDRQLTAAEAESQELKRRHDAALEEHAAARAAFERQAAEAAAARTALEATLAEAQSARQHAMQRAERAEDDLVSAEARKAALEDRLAQETDRGASLERQLSAAETARQETDRRHASNLAAAEAQLASLQARHDTAVTELSAASMREADLTDRLAQESDARQALDRDLIETRKDAARGRTRLLHIISTYRRRAREQKARFAQLQLEHETLQRLLGTTQDQVQHLLTTVEEERQAHERARLTSESEIHRVSAEYGRLHQSFDRLQFAFQTLEQVAGEHAAERARLETVVADRDSQLSAQAERQRVAEQNAQTALAELQDKLRQTIDTGGAEVARLQQMIDGLRRELDASRTHAEGLRGVAERVPDLQAQLERSQNERRREFERAPYPLCRCSPSGTIVEANHSFVALLGCRRVDELQNRDFVAAARDGAGDLGWLLERARKTRKIETVETPWKTRDGDPLVVRLHALATETGSVDIVAEDITAARGLEDRLRQAERMEAVGRLASEVAGTCDALLADVVRGANEWLERSGGDDASRRHAERLLTEVSRASTVLRQLGLFGNEQVRALEPVSVQRVVRDLAPVLKRLVGDQIELVLPKSAGSFDVDVDAERLERVFVNVAGYARDRMPSGGQVRIDLETTALGRRFAARYANVRAGDHVLITVTEVPAAGASRDDGTRSSDRPGVDLGVLADLITSCGGHLWLDAQPAGNMVVKIHLPKPPAAKAPDKRGGRLARWFRSTSTAKVRG